MSLPVVSVSTALKPVKVPRPSSPVARRGSLLSLVVLGLMGLGLIAAQAQTAPPPPGNMPPQPAPVQGQAVLADDARGPRSDRGPGMMGTGMMGPGMMGAGMPMMMVCGERSEMSSRFLKRFERAVQIKPEQKADLEALKTAVTKADQIFKAACPSQAELGDHTPVTHLARIEKTAQATLDAMKLVRPPFESLYAKLDDKQRDRLRWMPHEGGGSPLGWMQRMREGVHHLFDQDR